MNELLNICCNKLTYTNTNLLLMYFYIFIYKFFIFNCNFYIIRKIFILFYHLYVSINLYKLHDFPVIFFIIPQKPFTKNVFCNNLVNKEVKICI